jgi:hypothetical protein
MHSIGAYHCDGLNTQYILAENPSLVEKETHSWVWACHAEHVPFVEIWNLGICSFGETSPSKKLTKSNALSSLAQKKNYKYNTLHCAFGFGNGNFVFGFLSLPPSLPPWGAAFLISCPNPCRVPTLDMRLYPRTLATSGRCSLLAALTWNCVLYIHVHHCTTLVLLCYQATVSLHIVCSREKGDLHIYYTLHLLQQKAL